MYYEINVSKLNSKIEYEHFFATSERSIRSKEKLKEVHTQLKSAFPAPEYKISVLKWEKNGYRVEGYNN